MKKSAIVNKHLKRLQRAKDRGQTTLVDIETFRVDWLRTHGLDAPLPTLDEIEEQLYGPVVPKQIRTNLWLDQYGTIVYGTCALCDRHRVNVFSSRIVELYRTGTLMFVCQHCTLSTGMKVRRSQPFNLNRIALWFSYFGVESDQVCPCCQKVTMSITDSGWHSGHRLARAKGGPNTCVNLLPVCATCNISMGVTDLGRHAKCLGTSILPTPHVITAKLIWPLFFDEAFPDI
jgi:hypothetical protein